RRRPRSPCARHRPERAPRAARRRSRARRAPGSPATLRSPATPRSPGSRAASLLLGFGRHEAARLVLVERARLHRAGNGLFARAALAAPHLTLVVAVLGGRVGAEQLLHVDDRRAAVLRGGLVAPGRRA